MRTMRCPTCERVASVAEWIARPICVHSWLSDGTPEVWDGNDPKVEESPQPEWRVPGPKTWMVMVEQFPEQRPLFPELSGPAEDTGYGL